MLLLPLPIVQNGKLLRQWPNLPASRLDPRVAIQDQDSRYVNSHNSYHYVVSLFSRGIRH